MRSRRLSDIAQEQQNDNIRFFMIVPDKQFNYRLDLLFDHTDIS